MTEYELPLVFFTILCQWSIGSILALTVLFYTRPIILNDALFKSSLRKLAVGLFLLMAAGSSLSMLHLGSPLRAYRAILGIAHSWLSREVLAFICLNAFVFFWALAVLLNSKSRQILTVSTLTSAFGVIAILISAQVYYQMTARVLWHSFATHIMFLVTAVLLGFTTISLWLSCCKKDSILPRIMPTSIFLSALITAGIILFYAKGLVHEGELLKSICFMLTSKLFAWQILAGLVIPIVIAIGFFLKESIRSKTLAIITLLCVLTGAICGRMLFYGSVMQQAPWF